MLYQNRKAEKKFISVFEFLKFVKNPGYATDPRSGGRPPGQGVDPRAGGQKGGFVDFLKIFKSFKNFIST